MLLEKARRRRLGVVLLLLVLAGVRWKWCGFFFTIS